jgi:murein DD-endopeptidase MepM/ murein hydrolase activator NlpD
VDVDGGWGTSVTRSRNAGRGSVRLFVAFLLVVGGIAAAGIAVSTTRASASTGPVWPISGRIVQVTGGRNGHPGVDISASVGTPVYAAQGGKVTNSISDPAGYGCNVVIDHAGGWTTIYAHMSQTSFVPGTVVRQGALIGLSGGSQGGACSGNSTGPHLHFEFDLNGSPVRGWEHDAISVNQTTTANAAMPASPAGFTVGSTFNDGQIVRTPDGALYRVAGGAPLHLTGCAGAASTFCTGAITEVPQSTLTDMPPRPSAGVVLYAVETGAVYVTSGAAPTLVATCAGTARKLCTGARITVNQGTIDALEPPLTLPLID